MKAGYLALTLAESRAAKKAAQRASKTAANSVVLLASKRVVP